MTKIAAKAPTDKQDGNIEYYSCSCGKWFVDAQGATEIKNRDDIIIKANSAPIASDPQTPNDSSMPNDSSAPDDSSAPADTSVAGDVDTDKPAKKLGALPFIILGACATVAFAVAGVLIWSKKEKPSTK